MKRAIASQEIYGRAPDGARRRFSVAVAAPVRDAEGEGWLCRVTVADVLRPTSERGADSYEALARGMGRVRRELAVLTDAGWRLYADAAEQRSLDDEGWFGAG